VSQEGNALLLLSYQICAVGGGRSLLFSRIQLLIPHAEPLFELFNMRCMPKAYRNSETFFCTLSGARGDAAFLSEIFRRTILQNNTQQTKISHAKYSLKFPDT
jgi:hypothetical protein